jgi:hypothetical protein
MSDPRLPRPGRSALEADFDHDPGRFAANQLATQNFSMIGDVHDQVADRLAKITIGPFLILEVATSRWRSCCPDTVAVPSLLIALTTFAAHPVPRYRPTLRGCLIWARRP